MQANSCTGSEQNTPHNGGGQSTSLHAERSAANLQLLRRELEVRGGSRQLPPQLTNIVARRTPNESAMQRTPTQQQQQPQSSQPSDPCVIDVGAHCWSCFAVCATSRTVVYPQVALRRQHVDTHLHMFRVGVAVDVKDKQITQTQYAQLHLPPNAPGLADDTALTANLWYTCFPQCAANDLKSIESVPVTAQWLKCNRCGQVVPNKHAQIHYAQCHQGQT